MAEYGVDVLVIGAHPDDYEIGCGGTLIKLIRSGHTAAGVVVTDGSAAIQGTAEERRGEAERAAEILGLESLEWLGLEDGSLTSRNDLPFILAEVIRKYRPRTLLSHYFDDEHPDHVAVGESVEKAILLAAIASNRLSGVPHMCKSAYGFVVYPLRIPKGRIVVDISDVFEEKMELLKVHKSQFDFIQFAPTENKLFGVFFQSEAVEIFYPYTVVLDGLPL